jgi:hypothetical protein
MAPRHSKKEPTDEPGNEPRCRRHQSFSSSPSAIGTLCQTDEIDAAIAGYDESCRLVDWALQLQAEQDAETLAAWLGWSLSANERARFIELQHAASSETYLGAGREHRRVRAAIERLQLQAAA